LFDVREFEVLDAVDVEEGLVVHEGGDGVLVGEGVGEFAQGITEQGEWAAFHEVHCGEDDTRLQTGSQRDVSTL